MSGIAGIIHFDGRPVEPGQVEAMTAAMHYRGPDGINHWRRGHVALGQCMLRTTPESLEETQPLTNEEQSLVLVMDGRVDNWEELRRELLGKGAVLRTRADAELVLRAYEVWGRDCLSHIEGDFALVIWDARKQEAFCARDRVGNKPFNYHWNGRTLVFASELNTILALPWVSEMLNQGMLAEFLGTEWHSLDETLWQGVLRLKPSHFLLATGQSNLKTHRYWVPDLLQTLPCRTDEDYIEHYRALLTDVVRRMSRSLAPVACEVSGGLDSSAIFAVAETLRQQGNLPAPELEGYTLDFRGDPAADEMAYARAVGTHLGCTIHEVAPSHMPLDWYRETARHSREFPDYPNGAMGLSIAEMARARGSRVLLGGTGGDEWAGGCYLYYAEAIAGWRWRELLALLQRDTRETGLVAAIWRPFRYGVLPLLPGDLRHELKKFAAVVRAQGRDQPTSWLAPALQEQLTQRKKQNEPEFTPQWERLGQRRQWLNLWHPYVTLAREINERRASRTGLEWRQPFWNAQIIQAAFATPEHLRLRGDENKWLHRRSIAGLLPQQVLQRQSKAEFSIAFSRYWSELRPQLMDNVLPRRQDWIAHSSFHDVLSQAFEPQGKYWSEGIAWTLFGIDSVADQSPLPLESVTQAIWRDYI
ncbi:asparagine synthase (glutamine-hydrolyzing) [Hydrogenophaga sp.]|uniref:asparagine synthase (glutamine-hydrolyzing) n=1 Tax=Hydrogenophaga sp. TaxID=1904254 RepID=UPI002719EB18|nr:asparagine synthase (glutamine-hydrolyzing) [Hydrogenophaga sp.]MDO9606007.1 asparagine synthase (glutamine-hydrolyzing) [Hydrogenophaga sp.]